MDPRRFRLPLPSLLAAAALLLTPAAAGAAWFPADPVDGPGDIHALGGVDLARDGSGAVTYLKPDGGVPHVFVSRTIGGAFRAPERVDAGVGELGSQPVVAAGDDGRIVVAWISQGRLIAAVAPGGLGTPFSPPQFLAEDARDPHVDVGINGTAYIVYTTGGGGGRDVHAVRLQDGTWQQIGPALDVQPEQAAGDGAGRPRVAVSAEGNAVAVWGENSADGRRRVYGRRLTGLALSAYPQEISVPTFGGELGGAADSPDIDIEEDGSFAWVSFTQVVGGATRVLARRLLGSTFDPAVAIDGGPGSSSGRVAISGKGVGVSAAAAADNSVVGSLNWLDTWGPVARLDGPGPIPPQPVVGASDNEDSAVAWLRGTPAAVIGRHHEHDTTTFEDPVVLSRDGFGPAAQDGRLEMASDGQGNSAVAFLQGEPGARHLVVATFDRPPGAPIGLTSPNPRRTRRVVLKWRPGREQWGAQTFKVILDGVQVGETQEAAFQPLALTDGPHTWQVLAVDRRGQATPMAQRVVTIDRDRPRVRVRVTGRRVAGGLVKIRITAKDASRIRARWVVFGDGTRGPAKRGTVLHRYRRGTFTLTAFARDVAGNVGRKRLKVRIR